MGTFQTFLRDAVLQKNLLFIFIELFIKNETLEIGVGSFVTVFI